MYPRSGREQESDSWQPSGTKSRNLDAQLGDHDNVWAPNGPPHPRRGRHQLVTEQSKVTTTVDHNLKCCCCCCCKVTFVQ